MTGEVMLEGQPGSLHELEKLLSMDGMPHECVGERPHQRCAALCRCVITAHILAAGPGRAQPERLPAVWAQPQLARRTGVALGEKSVSLQAKAYCR